MQTSFSNLNAVCQLNEKELVVYLRVTDKQDDDEEDEWKNVRN